MSSKFFSFGLMLFSSMIIIGCENNIRQKSKTTYIEKPCAISNTPKLFLNYWGKMANSDYYCISNAMAKKHQIGYNSSQNQFYYVVNYDTLTIEPEFQKEKLYQISLKYPASVNYEEYAAENNGLTYPPKSIRNEVAITLKHHLILKYGRPIKDITKDDEAFGILSGHYEIYKWPEKEKTTALYIYYAPVYKTFLLTQNDGLVVKKYKIYKYDIERMTLNYYDNDLDKIANQNNKKFDDNLEDLKKGNSEKLKDL
ncbi:MAG: hypothetical protein V4456_11660 [Bacteroidota bacterium]